MVKAFAYLRVSGKGQVKGDGFPRQLHAIKSYAAAHEIKMVRVFREEGVTGAKESMDRPAWAEMMTALHGNGVRTIVIEKLDRLARDLMVQEVTIADLQKNGFTLISVAEPDLMATDPTRILMRQLMGAVAQYDKSQIVLKLRGARMRKRANEGRCEGRKPFGYYPGEAKALERICALRNEGLGFDRIAARLNAEGVPTRTKKAWHGIVVNRILTAQKKTAESGGAKSGFFSIHGFYSIACARKPDGSLDKDTVMIRARKIEHLRNLQARFPQMKDAKILTTPDRDYGFRLILPKGIWAAALSELASEQEWSNFKNQASANRAKCGADYVSALHDVWEIMNRLQKP